MDLGYQEALLMVQRCGINQAMLSASWRSYSSMQTEGPSLLTTSASWPRLQWRPASSNCLILWLGKGSAAFSIADDLLGSGERVEVLFYRILRHFQNLGRVAAMRDEGMKQDAIQTELKMKPFPVRKLMEQSSLLGTDGISRRLAVLAETDARMKGMGPLPTEMELQLCLGRLLSA